ncbi:kinase-like protein [Aspergillus sclerotiicarbonarius CBS 121057]|uniref:Kinase-like protein n=1 Tax=Aspergillus sclerotiicarbonarius (strain CBS 121057 / IBT 28362) TaxID=1448318 RepID=A0A319EHX9_ASPSB|nr:kinase-like protein [Aspergillus sclerotiicarbonarius CBS 121057]
MDFEDISLAKYEALKKEWIALCSTSSQGICNLASRYRGRDDCLLRSMHCGSFNFSFRLHWDDGEPDWLIRFPLPGKSMFLDEKVRNEAVLMKYIADKTRIPVPRVIGYGTAEDNPTGLGPYIIMTWVEGKKMSDILRKGGDIPEKEDVLNPDIDPQTLKTLYGEMADILLELWSLDFDSIGSVREEEQQASVVIGSRPLTLEINELIRTCGLEDCTPQRTFHSSVEYIHSLLALQDIHLESQRNSVYDTIDCREKYACRSLMKAVALNFVSAADNYGPFKLFCDDLCPGNVLVDDSLHVTGVIDWEFCYSAPAHFAGSIPWWLLLERPQKILNRRGPDAFFQAFLPRAEYFLESLQLKEKAKGLDLAHDRLSVRMRQSTETKSAWFYLACRAVSSVDLLYWDLLDEHCWGERSSVTDRVRALTTNNGLHKHREDFVRLKIAQLQEYYTELGEETDVIYEEEDRNCLADVKKTPGTSNESSHVFTVLEGKSGKNLVAGAAVACVFVVGLIWRRFHS